MKKCLLSTLLCVFALTAFCQQSDTISIKKSFGGLFFIKESSTHNINELSHLVATNTEAMVFAKKARKNNICASIFCCAGGFLIGYPLGTALGGGEPAWELAAVGAGSFVVGLVFDSRAKKNAREAVKIYNSDLNAPVSSNFKPELGIGLTGNGIGLSLRF